MSIIQAKSSKREELVEVTSQISEIVNRSDKREGVCIVFSQHTTCGVTVNENADPDVQTDMLGHLQKLIPQYEPAFKHSEQNSDAHIKTSIIGTSVTIPFAGGKLLLGRWQGIFLCEFDGPRERKLAVMMV